MNLIVRIILTALIVAWAAFPFMNGNSSMGIMEEVYRIGIGWTILITLLFFGMVALYCITLQKCLKLIKPKNRKANPKSVWRMFIMPFNFVEDFFIVINIANSLEEEKKDNETLKNISDFGMVSGIGWSIAQLMSFIPNIVGQISGLVGMLLLAYHWIHISKINRLLAEKVSK